MTTNTTLQLSRRRMVVQLASLVDLLFVILFLQYMQLRAHVPSPGGRGASGRSHAGGARGQDARGKGEKSALAVKETAMAQVDKLVQLRDNNQRLNDEIKALNTASSRNSGREAWMPTSGSSRRQNALPMRSGWGLAKVVQGMLGVDIGPVHKNASQRNIVVMKKQWDDLEKASPDAILQHLRKTAEMQKLCSIWEVHVNEDGTVRLRFGDAPWTFRPKNEDDFAQQIYDKSKEAGEPKNPFLSWRHSAMPNFQLATA